MSEQRQSSSRSRPVKALAALAAFVLVGLSVYASQSSQPLSKASYPAVAAMNGMRNGDATAVAQSAKAVAAGKAFLDALDANQRAKVVFEFGSPKKSGWSNLPVTNVPRNGVRMGDLTKPQHTAALELLAAVMSKDGYQKIIDIMQADEVYAKGGAKGGKGGKGGGKSSFGNDNYFLALFGTPSETEPWMVQFGGHHLGLNVTIVQKTFVLTPTHTGTQPQSFTRDGKTVRPLGNENDKAFDLIAALDDKQREQAILKEKVKEMILGPGKDGKQIKPQGVKGAALTEAQQTILLDLISQWVAIINEQDAAARMAEIKATLPDTYFAWSGPTAKGSAAYFRVQGPTLVIEYAPQGGTDHIHTVIRDPKNDYGQGVVKH